MPDDEGGVWRLVPGTQCCKLNWNQTGPLEFGHGRRCHGKLKEKEKNKEKERKAYIQKQREPVEHGQLGRAYGGVSLVCVSIYGKLLPCVVFLVWC